MPHDKKKKQPGFPLLPIGHELGIGQGPTAQQLYGAPPSPLAGPNWMPTLLGPEGMQAPSSVGLPFSLQPGVTPTVTSSGQTGTVTTPPDLLAHGARFLLPDPQTPAVPGIEPDKTGVPKPVSVAPGISFTSPFISAPKSQMQIPAVPGIGDAAAALEEGRPVGPEPVNQLAHILQAIASVGVDPNSPLGFTILRMGLAGLGGLGGAQLQQQEVEQQTAEQLREYMLQQAQVQHELQQQQYQNQIRQQQLLGEQESAAFKGRVFEQEQLTPSIKGSYLLQPTLEDEQVKTEVTALPSAKSHTAQMVQGLIAQQAMQNPEVTYKTLLTSPVGQQMVQKGMAALSEQISGFPSAPVPGLDLTPEQIGQLVSFIQQEEPDIFTQTVSPYINLSAGIQALGKRPLQ